MHDPKSRGDAFFKCDFCRCGWSEDRPMVEGHRGSLICAKCLSVAWAELVQEGAGEDRKPDESCRLCLEPRDGKVWRSPIDEAAIVCVRCVKQSAGVLHKDKESEWTKPTA